jgi:hypothetical protein
VCCCSLQDSVCSNTSKGQAVHAAAAGRAGCCQGALL